MTIRGRGIQLAKLRTRRYKNPEPEALNKATPGLPNGVIRPVRVSFALCTFLGGLRKVSRTQAAIKIWDHIKLNNLQTPKGDIKCDDKLKVLFDGKSKVGYLQISKLLTSHFVKAK